MRIFGLGNKGVVYGALTYLLATQLILGFLHKTDQ